MSRIFLLVVAVIIATLICIVCNENRKMLMLPQSHSVYVTTLWDKPGKDFQHLAAKEQAQQECVSSVRTRGKWQDGHSSSAFKEVLSPSRRWQTVSAEALCPGSRMAEFSVSSHSGGGQWAQRSLYKALLPFMGAPHSWPHHLPKPPS